VQEVICWITPHTSAAIVANEEALKIEPDGPEHEALQRIAQACKAWRDADAEMAAWHGVDALEQSSWTHV
jgi:hypothetical protein